mmetsp:Transcript_11253/g.24002  ORF Transcript_11253/g.24002 Transcript_11253/m.24002 type:complete len:214 (-) Transcript_11253:681-1322(-)
MNFELTNAEMDILTTAKEVNAMPTAFVSNPNWFWRREGKNAKKVLSAAWYRPETQATLRTPVHSFVPRGQLTIASASFFSSESLLPVLELVPLSFSFVVFVSAFDGVLSFINSITDSDANIEAIAEQNMTNDIRLELFPVTPPKSEYVNPPNAGPTMNASVDAASFQAKYLDKSPFLPCQPLSAKYALLIGLFPAKQPVNTLAAKKDSNGQHL